MSGSGSSRVDDVSHACISAPEHGAVTAYRHMGEPQVRSLFSGVNSEL